MKMETNLYTYADSWENPIHSNTLWKTVRRTYLYKSLPLLFCLPLDALVLAFILISGKRFCVLIATEKWPKLTEITAERARTACISPVTFIVNHFKSKASYFPASIFYLFAALGLALPRRLRKRWSCITVDIVSMVLRQVAEKYATIVVHSDALPFGRALVMAANKSGIRTVCIQHGNFREYNVIKEQDGFLCMHNIVRSREDGLIIERASTQTVIHSMPDFFKIEVNKIKNERLTAKVMLLGEGYHIIDEKFNIKYLEYLSSLEVGLFNSGVDVKFRPHPSERTFDWSARFRNIDLTALEVSLADVDAVIGYSSTLLQEAAEIGIPSFYVEPIKCQRAMAGRNGFNITKLDNIDQALKAAKQHRNDFSPDPSTFPKEDAIEKVVQVILTGLTHASVRR